MENSKKKKKKKRKIRIGLTYTERPETRFEPRTSHCSGDKSVL